MKNLPLAHPLAIAAVGVLVLNDHVFKRAFAGWLTGKLSDVAGMVFFPLLLASVVMVVAPKAARHRAEILAVACVATAIVFAATKTFPWANELYRIAWAAMQWPFRAARAFWLHRPTPALGRVSLVRDPSDLLAVPFVLVAYRLGAPRELGARRRVA